LFHAAADEQRVVGGLGAHLSTRSILALELQPEGKMLQFAFRVFLTAKLKAISENSPLAKM
jgi:hypothetical protein